MNSVRVKGHGMLALGIVAAMVLVVVTPLSSNQILPTEATRIAVRREARGMADLVLPAYQISLARPTTGAGDECHLRSVSLKSKHLRIYRPPARFQQQNDEAFAAASALRRNISLLFRRL